MRRIILSVFIVIFWCLPAFSFMGANWPGPGSAKVWDSGGGGIATYFYTASLADTDFTTGYNDNAANYYLGGQIAPTINGSAIKLRQKVQDSGSAINVRLCLFTDASPAVLLAGCVATTSESSAQEWVECTVSQTVNDITDYIVAGIPQSSLKVWYGPSGGGYFASGSYGSSCPSSLTFATDSDTHGAGMGVQ